MHIHVYEVHGHMFPNCRTLRKRVLRHITFSLGTHKRGASDHAVAAPIEAVSHPTIISLFPRRRTALETAPKLLVAQRLHARSLVWTRGIVT